MPVNPGCAITESAAAGLILASVVVTLGCDSFASFLRTLASWPDWLKLDLNLLYLHINIIYNIYLDIFSQYMQLLHWNLLDMQQETTDPSILAP